MKFLLLIFLLPLTLLAQKNEPLPKDLAGVWTGYMYNDTTQQRNDFELAISENNRKLSGYTYTIFLIDGKKNIGVKSVKIKARKESLLIEDEKLIDNNYDDPPAKGVRTFIELHYTENDTTEMLAGSWKTNITREYNSVTGNILVERKKQPEQTAIIPKLRQLNLLGQLSFLPRSGLPSVKYTMAGKQPSVSTDINAAQQKVTAETEKNIVGIVKNKKRPTETEKIIPDTTITNPEITVFMFSKNDARSKDSAMSGEKRNVLSTNKENPVLRKDTLVTLAGENESVKIKPETAAMQALDNDANQKTASKVATAKNNLDSGAKKAQKTDFPDVNKKNETVLSVPPATNNVPEKDSRKETEKSVVKTEVLSAENRKGKTESGEKNKKNEAAVLDPVSARNKETVQIATSVESLTAKNKVVDRTDKMRNTDSIVLDKKNDAVVLNNPVGKKDMPEIILKNKTAGENTATEIKEGGISAKEMETAARISAPKLITDEMISAREIETIRTVEIRMDTLIFSLFDNGVIDGDTVSVLLNGEVIMSKIGLLARAYNDTIYLTPEMGDSIHIILYAENLGSIPPNTGLLVVREGEINHEIRFSGDLKKNSAVILKRKKQMNGK